MIEPNSELVIDYELVRNNIQVIKSNLSANCKIMGIIKSNAYGHDLETAVSRSCPYALLFIMPMILQLADRLLLITWILFLTSS